MKRDGLTRYFREGGREEIERGWLALSSGLLRRQSRRPLYVVAFVVIAIAMLVQLSRWKSDEATGAQAVLVETNEQTQALALPEGSRVVVQPQSKLMLANVSATRIALELVRGAIEVEATHRAGRTFTVRARDLTIDVVGTRFRVDVGDGGAGVSVSEGRVRVTQQSDEAHPRIVGAGERWSVRAPERSFDTSPSATPSVSVAAVPHPPVPRHVLPAEFTKLYEQGRYSDAFELVAAGLDARYATLDADGLFAVAETARLSGHPREAAAAFDALRRRFRTNARAPLAALELGRLDLDDLDDPRGAKEALDDALALQPDGFFREDAEARRIEALEATGDRDACSAARDRYLVDHPNGSHRASVAKRCH